MVTSLSSPAGRRRGPRILPGKTPPPPGKKPVGYSPAQRLGCDGAHPTPRGGGRGTAASSRWRGRGEGGAGRLQSRAHTDRLRPAALTQRGVSRAIIYKSPGAKLREPWFWTHDTCWGGCAPGLHSRGASRARGTAGGGVSPCRGSRWARGGQRVSGRLPAARRAFAAQKKGIHVFCRPSGGHQEALPLSVQAPPSSVWASTSGPTRGPLTAQGPLRLRPHQHGRTSPSQALEKDH